MSTTTIWSVLNNRVPETDMKRGIKIPMIQRDYAQGRENTKATEIRKIFLDSIKDGIEGVIFHDKEPLELDFIYGYIETDSFVPLDGQQRLTTLFLIHWYFAFKENKLEEYTLPFTKFTYQTRQSSEEFLKKLALDINGDDHQKVFENGDSFSKIIKDKYWYFISWDHDLTIQSMLTMLDCIHENFKTSEIRFEHLINEEKPVMVFNFLDIENFGLSDNLYIKMNARGKPLNNFENLKAELGRYIERSYFNYNYDYVIEHSSGKSSVSVEQYFVTRIDTIWSDYFWNLRHGNESFDDKLLNLLANITLLSAVKESHEKYDLASKNLSEKDSEISFYKFNKLGLLNEEAVISYIDILDVLVSKDEIINTYFKEDFIIDKKELIEKFFNLNSSRQDRVQFHAIYEFILLNKGNLEKNELLKWERLVSNLTVNTIYNDSKDLRESILAIDHILAEYNGNIYDTISNIELQGFDNQQIREERLKIKMLLHSDDWLDLVLKAETNQYLYGQIMPLLSFSGVYDDFINETLEESLNSDETKNLFKEYLEKFDRLFNEEGLIDFEDELFRRALLAQGDYRLHKTNFSFIVNRGERDISWKRLLKETGNRKSDYWKPRVSYLKSLIDKIDIKDLEGSLKKEIQNHKCKGWRKDFIENPIIWKLSKRYFVKFYDNEDIYILRKTKYSPKYDPELKSVFLKQALLKKGFKADELEFGFSDQLNQYGLLAIKNRKPKVVFNNDIKKFRLVRRGNFDKDFSEMETLVDYLVKKYK